MQIVKKKHRLTFFEKQALDLMISIRLSRLNFWEYCLYYDPEFFAKRPFLKPVAVIMEWLYTEYMLGRPRRISVSMPPRAGKSYICSLFCSWWLGRLPQHAVMRNACTATLYMKFSYDVRKIVKSAKYKQVFPGSKMSPDKQNIAGWNLETAKQVSYFGAGVAGTIIGFGANLAISDDLYSGMIDAISEKYNDTVHTWKESDHDSRKELNCPEIYIGTRWTKQDVIGKALESGKIDREEKIAAMILNPETGEYESFCEDVKTTAEYLAMKADIEESIWEAEWMQEPIESKGLLFPKSGLHFFDSRYVDFDKAEVKFLYIDPANKGGDDLAGPHCYLIEDRIYVKNVIYNKDGTDLNGPRIIKQLIDTRTEFCNIEGNFGWAEFAKEIRGKVQEKHDDCQIRILNNTINKDTRILAMSAFIKNHFYFDQDYDKDLEYRAFMRNLTTYLKEGKAAHDDAPDGMAGCAKFFQSTFSNLW